MSLNVLDLGTPRGAVYVQHYEHRPLTEAAPIFRLNVSDGYWYDRFTAEAERIWSDATPWPLPSGQLLKRASRPKFTEDFGALLIESMEAGTDLLITGVTRNTLLTTHYSRFETWLMRGMTIRVLLMDPDAHTVAVAAERYYAERSQDSVRYRCEQSLRLLSELLRSTHGQLQVRLTAHPLATGLIAVDAMPEVHEESSAIFLEYYSYQARGEPKLTLQPGDRPWFEHFLDPGG
jgi:hypothetical protein